MSLRNAAVICLSALLFSVSSSAAVYRWVDERGQVHFSDRPLAADAETVTLKNTTRDWQPLDIDVIQQGSLQHQAQVLDISRIRRDVNNVYRFYKEVIYFDFYRQVPVKIHLLPGRAEYLQFVAGYMGVDASQSLGIYIPPLHEIAVYLHEEEYGGLQSTYATIRHEASHAILHSVAERLPLWLHEGMSEQMETLSDDNGRLLIRTHPRNRYQLLQMKGKAQDVLTFTEIPGDRWQRDNVKDGMNQAMAGQLAYMLLSTGYGRSLITRLLQDYRRGVNKRSYYLLDEHYVGGRQALQIHWQRWLKDGMKSPDVIRFQDS